MSPRGLPHLSMTALNGLCLCLVICAVGLLASQAVGPIHIAILLLAAGWQWWRWSGRAGAHDARRGWWEAASLAALFFFIGDLFVMSRDLVGSALRLLAFIVAYHADNPQPARRTRQTLGLTLIQMIAASASTTEVVFSLLMTAYLVVALWTLAALGAAEREAPRPSLSPAAPSPDLRAPLGRMTLATVPAVLAGGLGIFFLIPHYGTGYFREQGKSIRRSLTGFSDRIELGSIGSIKKSHATVMRVDRAGSGQPPPLPMRLRGVALDAFDGRVWERSDQSLTSLHKESTGHYIAHPERVAALPGEALLPGGAPRDWLQRRDILSLNIMVEPLETRVFFTPPELLSVTPLRFQSVAADTHGNLYAAGPRTRRFPYGTASLAEPPAPGEISPAPLSASERQRYLQVPRINPEVAELGRQVTAGLDGDTPKARALESWLLGGFRYSLDVNDTGVRDPLTHLLIDNQPGHCEYFATALAILLRLEGIPARVVTGFHGGEFSELTGQVIIRQSDAHSWVEAWLPETGWTVLDATPPDPDLANPGLLVRLFRLFDEVEIAWDTYIVGLDLQDQRSALEEIRDWFDLAASGTFIALRERTAALRRMAGIPDGGLPGSDGFHGVALVFTGSLAAALGIFLAWRRIARVRSGLHPATELFRRFEKQAAARGGPREPWMSPAAYARSRQAPDIAAAYEAARYGPPAEQPRGLRRMKEILGASPGR